MIGESSAKISEIFPGLCSWGVGKIHYPARNFLLLEALKHISRLEKRKKVVSKSFHSQQWIFFSIRKEILRKTTEVLSQFFTVCDSMVSSFFILESAWATKPKKANPMKHLMIITTFANDAISLGGVLKIWIQIIIFDLANRWDFFLLSVLSLFWGF